MPHKAIHQGTVTEILVHQPSTIYVAHEEARSGGFHKTLPKIGWTLVTDNAQVGTGQPLDKLKYIWKKVVSNDSLTVLSLPATTTSETVHCIFAQSNPT